MQNNVALALRASKRMPEAVHMFGEALRTYKSVDVPGTTAAAAAADGGGAGADDEGTASESLRVAFALNNLGSTLALRGVPHYASARRHLQQATSMERRLQLRGESDGGAEQRIAAMQVTLQEMGSSISAMQRKMAEATQRSGRPQ